MQLIAWRLVLVTQVELDGMGLIVASAMKARHDWPKRVGVLSTHGRRQQIRQHKVFTEFCMQFCIASEVSTNH